MKRLEVSEESSSSMRCSSSLVPSVAVTSACVSPRVNSAEPWVRGSTPTSTSILRTSSNLRPSGRRRSLSISSRKMRSFSASNSFLASAICSSGMPSMAFFLAGVDARVAFELLVLLGVHRVLQLGADGLGDLIVQRLVDGRRRIGALGLAGLLHQLLDALGRSSCSNRGRTRWRPALPLRWPAGRRIPPSRCRLRCPRPQC